MKDLVKKVKIREPLNIENITIQRDHYFSKAYVIDLPLDSTPDHIWQDIFEREWKSSRHMWDRKLFVIGDKLRMVTTAYDIEDKLDWVKQILERTNLGIDEYIQEAEARTAQTEAEERGTIKAPEDEKTSVDAIKDTIRKRFGTY
jgi:hypothetical protein